MTTHLIFSAGAFVFGMDLDTVDHIERSHSEIELQGKFVQNFHNLFSEKEQPENEVSCWIVKKDGNALGVNGILGMGEVTTYPMPAFLRQNMKFRAITELAEFQSTIIFLIKSGEGQYEKLQS